MKLIDLPNTSLVGESGSIHSRPHFRQAERSVILSRPACLLRSRYADEHMDCEIHAHACSFWVSGVYGI